MVQIRPVHHKPALMLEGKQRFLAITDLHIGFESSMISNDINVNPKSILEEVQSNLDELIELEKPDSLVILGDVKSSISHISKIEWDMVPEFFQIGNKINTIVIPGNHDGNISKIIPNHITMTSHLGLVVEDTLLTHGHAMPSENFASVDKIVIGHIHPVYFQKGSVLDGQRLWVSIKTDKSKIFPSSSGKIEIIIVPSFNRYFYATHKRQHKKSISPILEKIKGDCTAKIVTLDGSIIGDESILGNII